VQRIRNAEQCSRDWLDSERQIDRATYGGDMTGATIASGSTSDATRGIQAKSLRATVIGNVLEWFDWTIYATFSPYIAKAIFAPSDSMSALLQTLAVFAVGFLARPIGGIVCGRLADKRGRRFSLVFSMSLMAAGSLLLALTPAYSRIGVLASVWLLATRLLQGFAHGGETSASYAYVSELAPASKRGLWSSSVFASSTLGVVLGSLIGVALTQKLPTGEIAAWGWRLPFVIGAFLGLYAYYLRRNSIETHVAASTSSASPTSPTTRNRKQAYVSTFKLFTLLGATVVAYYTWLSFATTYAITSKGVPAKDAFIASLAAQVICMLSMPAYGALSDRIGRKPIALLSTIGFVVLSFPLDSWFTSSAWSLFIVQTVALLLWSSIGAIYPALMAEQFSTGPRALGIGVSTSFAAVVFGGTAPYLNTWLTSIGKHWMFTGYTVVLCAIATIVVLTMKETRGIDLSAMPGD
jgi:MHS family alpha-ketoglutarate permease-like MFS transporter